jgi:hypothetical protein
MTLNLKRRCCHEKDFLRFDEAADLGIDLSANLSHCLLSALSSKSFVSS